jgi:TPP-dependent pyruvate/acetoin dehydrogenase alpha subunit
MQPKWMGPPMAFTKDELQSLNTIMEEKLAAQRAALEQVFDQRVQAIRNEIEQQLATNQQQVLQEVRNEIEQQLAGNQQQILQAVTQNAQEQKRFS